MKFEMNVDSFQRYINTRRDKAKEISKNALLRANEEIDEIIYQTAPVHVQGYFEFGIEWDGGTLRDSFIAETYIGAYEVGSVYRMSGEENPIALGDYAHYQEHIYRGHHNQGKSPFLQPAVEIGFEELLTFISNDLYLE